MKYFPALATVLIVVFALGLSTATASDTNRYIKQLKDPDLKVRIKAAHELGCG